MLSSIMMATMAAGLAAGGQACTDDFQSARMASVDPLEVSAARAGSTAINAVEVLATVNADGRVGQVATLGEGVPEQIARAVENASVQWRFEPARACGQAVAQEVSFALPVLATRFSQIQNAGAPGPAHEPRSRDRPQSRTKPWEAY